MQMYSLSPSSSSQSEDEYHGELSPTQLLSLAIKKRRALFARKERDYHQELLQTGFIQSLCKHLGERRARRRKRGGNKTPKNILARQNLGCTESSNEVPVTLVEPVLQTPEPAPKRLRFESSDDPFGLDDFFAQLTEKRKSENYCQDVDVKC